MEFRLYYRGPLKSNRGPVEKQAIRRQFHPQLKRLWEQPPLAGCEIYLDENSDREHLVYQLRDFRFACLVSERHHTFAELDILFLRPEPAGAIIKSGGGDIDNRLKTLFDGLRRPILENEIVEGDSPKSDETPFHCLLSDDALITKVSVTTDQLLSAPSNGDDVVLIINVRIKSRNTTWDSMGFF
jgi:hypothetical protein